jgi:hypothetical protein
VLLVRLPRATCPLWKARGSRAWLHQLSVCVEGQGEGCSGAAGPAATCNLSSLEGARQQGLVASCVCVCGRAGGGVFRCCWSGCHVQLVLFGRHEAAGLGCIMCLCVWKGRRRGVQVLLVRLPHATCPLWKARGSRAWLHHVFVCVEGQGEGCSGAAGPAATCNLSSLEGTRQQGLVASCVCVCGRAGEGVFRCCWSGCHMQLVLFGRRWAAGLGCTSCLCVVCVCGIPGRGGHAEQMGGSAGQVAVSYLSDGRLKATGLAAPCVGVCDSVVGGRECCRSGCRELIIRRKAQGNRACCTMCGSVGGCEHVG